MKGLFGISSRSFIVYFNFLFIPVVLTLLWLFLPIGTYVAFSGTSMVYFILSFLTWISFYDLNLPGCSKIQIVFFLAGYIAVSIGWLSVVTKLNKEENRIAYSFIDGIVVAFCALCYLIHIIVHKFKKQYIYTDETVLDERGVKRRKRRSKPWTKRLSKIFCYYSRIDMDEDDQKEQIAHDIMSDTSDKPRSGSLSIINNNNQIPTTPNRPAPPPPTPQRPLSMLNKTPPSHPPPPPPRPSSVMIAPDNLNTPPPPPPRKSTIIQQDTTITMPSHPTTPQKKKPQNNITHSAIFSKEEIMNELEGGGIEMTTFSETDGAGDQKTVEFFKKKKGSSDTGGDLSSRTTYTGQLRISPSIMDELMPKHELSFRNFLCVLVYQLFVVGTWFWLHQFTTLVVDKNLFSTPFLALLSIVVFQISRIVLAGISNGLNRLLKPRELKYFTLFQFPLMFFLYYRNLFLNINNWGITVLVSVVLFVIDVVYYPLHMTKRYWIFRHQSLAIYLEKRGTTSRICRILRLVLDDPNPSYEQHVCKLSVEYYYDKIAEYTSITTMVVFLSLIRGLSYKIDYYPKFAALSQDSFHQLLFRYLYLLLFEFAYDLAIRFFARKFMKIDISNRGRNETISNFTTRFIFALFVLIDLMDVYNAQVSFHRGDNSSSNSPPEIPILNSTSLIQPSNHTNNPSSSTLILLSNIYDYLTTSSS